MTPPRTTVGGHLVSRLEHCGPGHVSGVPGDDVLGFHDQLVRSRLAVVGSCTEIGAGLAADAPARVAGLGAACVTYCVAGPGALHAVAGVCAEKSAARPRERRAGREAFTIVNVHPRPARPLDGPHAAAATAR